MYETEVTKNLNSTDLMNTHLILVYNTTLTLQKNLSLVKRYDRKMKTNYHAKIFGWLRG